MQTLLSNSLTRYKRLQLQNLLCTFYTRFLGLPSFRQPLLKPREWDKLLSDMLKLRNDIFDCISASVCYEVRRPVCKRVDIKGNEDYVSIGSL